MVLLPVPARRGIKREFHVSQAEVRLVWFVASEKSQQGPQCPIGHFHLAIHLWMTRRAELQISFCNTPNFFPKI